MVRVKRRYIVLKIQYQSNNGQSQESFIKELRDKIGRTYGDFGVACLNRGFSVKKYDTKDGFMILCVRKGVEGLVMSVLPLTTSVDRHPCSVNIVHLSGTIRGCLKKLRLKYIMNLRAAIAGINIQ